MGTIPKFKFVSSISEKELVAEETKLKGDSKQFSPGRYDLKIIDAMLHISKNSPDGRSSTDPNWFMVILKIGGINDKVVSHLLMVPTITDIYNKPGIKDPRILFKFFRDFVRSLGIDSSIENMGNVLNEYFVDVSALIGKELSVDIGYEGNHAKYDTETKTFSIVNASEDKTLFSESFPDRDSATAFAAGANLTLLPFTKVKKFIAKEIQTTDLGW